MTLLESVVAFVILAVVGVACLDLSRGATSVETRAVAWSRAVSTGDAALAAAIAGERLEGEAWRTVRIDREPWRGGTDGLDVVNATVQLPNGEAYRVSRLAPRVRAVAAQP